MVAAPLPSAAALVKTSSLEAVAIIPEEEEAIDAGGEGWLVTAGAIDVVARGGGWVITGPRLLISSSMFCWSAFFRPCRSEIYNEKNHEISTHITSKSKCSNLIFEIS